jgi:hypothetical protein
MIDLFVTIIVVILLASLAIWILRQFPPPEPFYRIAYVVIVVVACLVIIYALLGITGHQRLLLR